LTAVAAVAFGKHANWLGRRDDLLECRVHLLDMRLRRRLGERRGNAAVQGETADRGHLQHLPTRNRTIRHDEPSACSLGGDYCFITHAKRRRRRACAISRAWRSETGQMTNNAAFTGNIPEHYDQGLGPILFVEYADDIARRVAAYAPKRVLETAAGTGIV